MQQEKGIIIVTAIELTDADKVRLEQRLQKIISHFHIKYEVDASIVAGIIIKTSTKIIDDSTMRKLEDLKLTLSGYGVEQVELP